MRLAKLDNNLIGEKIVTSIKLQDGRKLINAGTQVTQKLLERLKSYNLNAVYIEDENLDIELNETISKDKKVEIIKKLNGIYKDISEKRFNETNLNTLIRNNIINEISNETVNIMVDGILGVDDMAEHSLNVCLLSIATGIKLGMSRDKLETLAKAALLHDIGKLFINNKNTGHEQVGFEFLKNKASSVLLYTTVRYHHETIDGKGPQNQSKEHQHDMVKILSLTNYYDNLLRKGNLLHHECFEKVQSLVNIKFDKAIYDAFSKSVYIYPVGLPVRLSNQESGIVVRQNNNYSIRPVVRTKKQQYNLLQHLSLFIEKVEL